MQALFLFGNPRNSTPQKRKSPQLEQSNIDPRNSESRIARKASPQLIFSNSSSQIPATHLNEQESIGEDWGGAARIFSSLARRAGYCTCLSFAALLLFGTFSSSTTSSFSSLSSIQPPPSCSSSFPRPHCPSPSSKANPALTVAPEPQPQYAGVHFGCKYR